MLHRLLVLTVVASATVVAVDGAAPRQAPTLPDVFLKAKAYYATLTSYSDTGAIRVERPGVVDDAKFTTYFRRANRDFYFEYQGLTSVNPATKYSIDMSGQRSVIWMAKGEMQTFDFKTGSHEIINPESGGQVRALSSFTHISSGTSILVPSFLYSQARLASTLLQLEEGSLAGTENVGSRPCHKIVGIAAAYYPSGQRTGARPVTVWIDVESQLVRKVFEDTPKGSAARAFFRKTITIEPRANPQIDDGKFTFTIPER